MWCTMRSHTLQTDGRSVMELGWLMAAMAALCGAGCGGASEAASSVLAAAPSSAPSPSPAPALAPSPAPAPSPTLTPSASGRACDSAPGRVLLVGPGLPYSVPSAPATVAPAADVLTIRAS